MIVARETDQRELRSENPGLRHAPRARRLIFLALWGLACSGAAVAQAQSPKPAPHDVQFFDDQIAPLIGRRCLSCHSGQEPKGKLDLGSSQSAMSGGESGRVIEPGAPLESLMWEYIQSDEMPPKEPLKAQEKELFRMWFAQSAKWGAERIDATQFSNEQRAGNDWWSLQPLQSVVPPQVEHANWTENPIDGFVLTRLRQAGLAPNAEADKRTLIRRLTFDLLGLPPTPAEIAEFLADTSELAYEHLVDRLLKSPHYGERWARHWLDVVRFGESNGFEYDEPRDNFWHYRNWVIQALNADLPYDEFVRLQLAGDVMHPQDMNAIAAAGFLVAGPHNTTLPANEPMRMSMAQDELEDLVGTVGQTFLGLTINCARCHDHKFDPISQREYYQFVASLAGVKHGEKKVQVALPPEQQQRLIDIERRGSSIKTSLQQLEEPPRQAVLAERKGGVASTQVPPKAFATWEFNGDLRDNQGVLELRTKGAARIEDGCLVLDGDSAFAETKPLPMDVAAKTLEAWVQLDNLDQRGGGAMSLQSLDGSAFDAIVYAEREPKMWMAGSNNFLRTADFQGAVESEAVQEVVHLAIVYHQDGTITGYRNGAVYGESYRPRELHPYSAGSARILVGLRHGQAGKGRMLAGRIHRAQFYDRALSADEVAASAGVGDSNFVSRADLLSRFSPTERDEFQRLTAEAAELETERAVLLNAETHTLYSCVSGEVGVTQVLLRGNVATPGDVVSASGLTAVTGPTADFGLPSDASDAQRRMKLASWVTDRDNPLFSRVMVNRVWQYHFGRGLIATSSDFGFNGGQPSHPELLDWLAQAFRDGGFRLKPLHRLMVTSATYRQSSEPIAASALVDADNRWLWRKSPQRLEAEEIRDAVLVATGGLKDDIGGQGYRDVQHVKFKGSNFYEALEESGPEARRRTIYRFAPRGGRNTFLDIFDCPDPSTAAPQRASTTTPLQALSLMNNSLMFARSDEFARRVQLEAGVDPSARINLIYGIAYGRDAVSEEFQIAHDFVEQYGLASFCRVILNSNEFLYVR